MVCMMSPNGSVVVIRCLRLGEEPQVLAERREDDQYTTPIGVLVLDQGGQALKFVIDHGGRVKPEAS